MEFIGVELAAPVENAAADPVEKAVAGCTGGEGKPLAGEGTACDPAWRGMRGHVAWDRWERARDGASGRHGDFCDLGSGFRANGRPIPSISV